MTIKEAANTWMPVVAMGVKDMPEIKEAVRMSIASLEAWEVVRQEIIKQSVKVPTLQNEYLNGLKTAYAHTLAIIDKHLQEMEE